MNMPLRTLSQAKAWLDERGKSVQEFAREHGLCPSTTYQVLSGHKKGIRGKSHAAAVCLGIKAGSRDDGETGGH
jgi:gp16 family phage-associated protein